MCESMSSKYWRPSTRKSIVTFLLMFVAMYGMVGVAKYSLYVDKREAWIWDAISQLQPPRKGSVEKFFNGTPGDDLELVEYIRDKKLLLPSTEPYNLLRPDVVDASQFGQTKDLDNMLRNMTFGFFVEAGAYDGEQLSNTLYFERFRNWTGLLIEADPGVFNALKTKKRKSHAINACLSLTPAAEILQFIPAGFLGRVAPGGTNAGVSLQCVPLYTLMLALGRSQIDLFSLDIEGDELKVLKTIPWDKMQIRLMIIEVNHIKEGNQAVINYMESVGYTLIKAHLIDLIFAKKDLLDQAGL